MYRYANALSIILIVQTNWVHVYVSLLKSSLNISYLVAICIKSTSDYIETTVFETSQRAKFYISENLQRSGVVCGKNLLLKPSK